MIGMQIAYLADPYFLFVYTVLVTTTKGEVLTHGKVLYTLTKFILLRRALSHHLCMESQSKNISV